MSCIKSHNATYNILQQKGTICGKQNTPRGAKKWHGQGKQPRLKGLISECGAIPIHPNRAYQ